MTENASSKLRTDRPWLWVTRMAAFILLLFFLYWWLGVLISEVRWPDRDGVGALLLLATPSLVLLLYCFVALELFGKRVKKGLALAIGSGSLVVLLLGVLGAIALSETRTFWEILWQFVGWGVVLLLHVTLSGSAIKTYSTMPREASDKRTLLFGFLKAGLFLGLATSGAFLLRWASSDAGSRVASNESSAMRSLRQLHNAEANYAATYQSGFTDDLAKLGPPAPGASPTHLNADLIDKHLAGCPLDEAPPCLTGMVIFNKNGYTFTYMPGSSDTRGRIITYTLSARPREYKQSGRRSFFTNESGVIRSTDENRAATAHDAPLW